MNHFNLTKARQIYSEGKNVTEFLREEFQEKDNTSEIIEIAYDLQAGSYIDFANADRQRANIYANELAGLLEPHLLNQSSLLDVGTGELTTLSLLLNNLQTQMSQIFAFDISWSRLYKGKDFFHKNCNSKSVILNPFVADIKQIPLCSKSVDIVTSSHALEPNGRELSILLNEIFRVTKNKCILFEPSYELNSEEGKRRMEKLGYIKDIEGTVKSLGGRVLDVQLIKNVGNTLNPTACFVIEPPKLVSEVDHNKPRFSVPGTDFLLNREGQFLTSLDTGLLFPVLHDIPILKSEVGILGTALF